MPPPVDQTGRKPPKINVANPASLQRNKQRQTNYLKEFQDKLELRAWKKKKIWEAIKKGELGIVDMAEIVQNARINANKKPFYEILLSHMSLIRQNRDCKETTRLEITMSFAKLRRQIQKELDNVIVRKETFDRTEISTYVSVNNHKTIAKMIAQEKLKNEFLRVAHV